MKVAIIGAGLAGAVASGAFAQHKPVNYDLRPSESKPTHKAIMRLRDVNVAKYLGTHVEPINVWKQVAFGDVLFEHASIRMNNLYSLKLYGVLGQRSLTQLGHVKRWLIEGVPKPRETKYSHHLIKAEDGEITFNVDEVPFTYDYDVCISTIPLKAMLQACGMTPTAKFVGNPIYVWRNRIKHPSNLHQTIYFPEHHTAVYRATLQGQEFIVESIDEIEEDWSWVAWHFGLDDQSFENDWSKSKQPLGKMLPIPENSRRQYIYELTDKFNIFSFGRYGIWKPIRADHLVSDIERIRKLTKLQRNLIGYTRNKIMSE